MKKEKLAKILFVEDSKNEFILNNMILRRENVVVDMDHVRDGVEAFDYLNKKNKYKDLTELPDLILLDQRLISMDGDEFLKLIKEDVKFNTIPVVMFSGVVTEEQREKFTKLGAIDIFNKPVTLDKLQEVVNKAKFLSFISSEGRYFLCKV